LGILLVVSAAVMASASCGWYNQVMARKNLVDGSKAYKDRKFPQAIELFRYAASLDPQGDSVEGRTAQLSLARTLHSQYIGDRQNTSLAQQALAEYQKALPMSLRELTETQGAYEKDRNSEEAQRRYLGSLSNVNSTTSAISSLYENLQQPEKAREWQLELARDAKYPPTARVRALSSLAAKQNSCANEITDTDATKKTVKGPDGKDTFQFTKPANPEEFARLNQCVAEGKQLIDQAIALEPQELNNVSAAQVSGMSDTQLALNMEIFKTFESARSYKSALLVQEMRAAEMDGRTADRDRLRAEADAAKARYAQLGDVTKAMQAEIDARVAAKEEAAKPENQRNANANTAK
jgi:hypothetical protein